MILYHIEEVVVMDLFIRYQCYSISDDNTPSSWSRHSM